MNQAKAIRSSIRQVYWLSLFMTVAIVGALVALLADAAAWCEDKMCDALNAIEEHL